MMNTPIIDLPITYGMIKTKSITRQRDNGCWRCYPRKSALNQCASALKTINEISYDYTVDPNYSETELEPEIQTGRYCT